MAGDNRLKLIQQADKLFKAGKVEPSLKEYQKVLDLKPDDIEIRKIIGDLKFKLNKVDEAVKQFEWIAEYYLKEGFYPKATAMFKRITRIDPQNESVSFKLADLYAKQGLVIEAKQIYLELVEEYKRQSNHKKALNVYKKILEFDRGNTKMHLLLAENYLRENMVEEAVGEYLFTADILIKRKEVRPAEEILQDVLKKVKNIRIMERLVGCYLAEGNEQQAIGTLSSLGDEIYKHPNLLKILGELYLKRNQFENAERIYKKLIEFDTSQTEMIMNLGKVYIQKEDYDRVYQLFLPLVERYTAEKKYDEATSLLRFIITSNNSYMPALLKLASIFKTSGKTNSLIAIYESLIPIYEKKKMIKELKEVLTELIKISDTPFNYQEMLQRYTEEKPPAVDADQKEREFISFQLGNVGQAIRESNFKKAQEILITAKGAFPRNVEIRAKLFDVLQLSGNIDMLLDEGIELLEIYKERGDENEYNNLYEKLSRLRPNDDRLLFISGNEKTNIEIDFDQRELIEQMGELHYSSEEPEPPKKAEPEEEVFLLAGEDSVTYRHTEEEKDLSKGLSSHLVELDFYISEGYFDNAQKILVKLREEYPESKEVISRFERLQKVKDQRPEMEKKEAPAPRQQPPPPEPPARPDRDDEFVLEEEIQLDIPVSDIREESGFLQKFEDSKVGLDAFPLKVEEGEDLLSGVKPSKAKEEKPQEEEVEELLLPVTEPAKSEEMGDAFNLEIEMERAEEEPLELIPLAEEDQEKIIQSPSVKPESEKREERKSRPESQSSSSVDLLNLDNILMEEEAPPVAVESPFREIEDLVLDSEEQILKDDDLLLEEESYFEAERRAKEELEAIDFWTKELEKQKTSTMEKNMMEIFKEFKRGVDEKIGSEDFETRYNLGIAYKEMGLLEEAIHEFLISAKHQSKFFDSAGMLGICFREKGMLDESIGWLEKALKNPDRSEDEIKAIKFELFMTARLKEDYVYARKLAAEIQKIDPEYRNIQEFVAQIKNR